MTVSPSIPEEASNALNLLRQCLGDDLLAAYLHGSAVAGGLRAHSDVDVLAVVDQPMSVELRRELVKRLLRISAYPAREGGPRPLEVIILGQADLRDGSYPPRAEFVYGEWLRPEFEAGAEPRAERDFELVPVLAWARQCGLALYGPPAHELLPAVSMDVLRRAMRDALPALLASMEGDERNVLLTLARMWHTSSTGDIVPKDLAAQWAIARLPREPARLLELARADYLGLVPGDALAGEHRTAVERAARCLQSRVERHLS